MSYMDTLGDQKQSWGDHFDPPKGDTVKHLWSLISIFLRYDIIHMHIKLAFYRTLERFVKILQVTASFYDLLFLRYLCLKFRYQITFSSLR